MTGIKLITKEREEQLTKHNRTIEADSNYQDNQLMEIVNYILKENTDAEKDNIREYLVEVGIDKAFLNHLDTKSNIEQLSIAGALIAAEIDAIIWKQSEDRQND